MTGCQALCDADICQILIRTYYSTVSNKNIAAYNTLSAPLFNLIKVLMVGYLTSKDLSTLLRYAVRPEIVPDPTGYALLPPWLASNTVIGVNEGKRKDNNKKWSSLDLLLDIQKKSNLTCQAVPYVELGGEIKPYLAVIIPETRVFSQSAFTYSVWIQMRNEKDSESGCCIPVLSLSGPNNCYFEVHWEVRTRLIRVGVWKRGKVSVIHFQLPHSLYLNTTSWNLFVLSVHAKKQVVKGAEKSAKSAICLFFNGLPCQPVGAHLIAIEGPLGPINASIGRYVMDFNEAKDEGTEEDIRINLLEQPLWNLGPVLLWDDSLSVTQLSLIFLRGPTYTGNFQAESPLSDYLASVSCDLLRRCDCSGIPIKEYTRDLGLQGLECVVDPPVEQLSTLVSSYDLPALPPPLLAYSAESSNIVRTVRSADSNAGDVFTDQSTMSGSIGFDLYLQNAQSHGGYDFGPLAVVMGGRALHPGNLGTCVASLGGPSILFPMIQAATSEEQLIGSLRLIRYSIIGSISNLKYMQVKGYKMLGYLLSIKKREIFSTALMDELFEFSISRGHISYTNTNKSDRNVTVLLTDTPAFYYLLLNHQVWSLHRYHFARNVLNYLKILSCDGFHGELNSRRLATLGTPFCHLYAYLFVVVFICICLFIYLFIHLFIILFVHLLVYLLIYLLLCLCAFLFIHVTQCHCLEVVRHTL